MKLQNNVRADFVPASDYTSAEFAKLELQHVWKRTWQIACREEDIPQIGDYAIYEIGLDSILVVRSASDQISGFYNVCQHRGRRLKNADEERGNVANGVFCRYHGWRWDVKGNLAHIPDREDWSGCPEFGDKKLS